MAKPYNIVTSATGPPNAGDRLAESLPLRPVRQPSIIQQRGGRAVQVIAATGQTIGGVAPVGGGGGGGTASISVGLSAPATFTVTGSPVTTSGTIVVAWQTVPQNFVLVGPVSGAGAPTFRALTAADVTSALQKRRVMLTFYPASTTADTAPNITQVARLPKGTGGASSNWKLMSATLRVETPNAAATTVQLYWSAGGNAAFGAGTAAISSALSASSTSTYEVGTTSFTGTLATTGLSSGTLLAPQFSALGGQNVSLEVEFEEI